MEFKELLKRCVRIIHISRKPTSAEFSKTAKVTAVGMLIFGLTGFIISTVLNYVNATVPGMLG